MMLAFDTDVMTLVLLGHPSVQEQIAVQPNREYRVRAIVLEELMRGRLAVIRQAEGGRAKVSIDRAYQLLEQTFEILRTMAILPYTAEAEVQFQEWRRQTIRGSTHDLRIAASCFVSGVTLISRNRRDFDEIPELSVEYW